MSVRSDFLRLTPPPLDFSFDPPPSAGTLDTKQEYLDSSFLASDAPRVTIPPHLFRSISSPNTDGILSSTEDGISSVPLLLRGNVTPPELVEAPVYLQAASSTAGLAGSSASSSRSLSTQNSSNSSSVTTPLQEQKPSKKRRHVDLSKSNTPISEEGDSSPSQSSKSIKHKVTDRNRRKNEREATIELAALLNEDKSEVRAGKQPLLKIMHSAIAEIRRLKALTSSQEQQIALYQSNAHFFSNIQQ